MKDSLLAAQLRQDSDHPGHFILQELVSSQPHGYISIQEADAALFIKLDMVRRVVVLGKDRRQGHGSIQHSVLYGKLLILHHPIHLNAVKKRHAFISGLVPFDEDPVPVEIYKTVKIGNTAHCFLLLDADDNRISCRPGNGKRFHKGNIVRLILRIKDRGQNGIGCHRPPQDHLFDFVLRVMLAAHNFHVLHMKICKEEDNGSQKAYSRTSGRDFFLFFC